MVDLGVDIILHIEQQPRSSFFVPCNPGVQGPVHSESVSECLRLIIRLGRPFSAFLLAQQPSGEYKRIASDRNIMARVKDLCSQHDRLQDTRDIVRYAF
ncbi:hypothetical protein EV702DRAFT_415718 [Suillus placidus]|uniref:Uncharacterized protein n=1 Tax=Suillus placidus TaxID=48579 RepID=A0A9P6ZSD7_9AGAM|nr:hypothetical protein EV702DRAFT_415718 [Suillus placidus]